MFAAAAMLVAIAFSQNWSIVRDLSWPGPPEEVWEYVYDTGVPLHPVFDGLPPDQRDAAIAEVIAAHRQHDDGRRVQIPAVVVLASAVR